MTGDRERERVREMQKMSLTNIEVLQELAFENRERKQSLEKHIRKQIGNSALDIFCYCPIEDKQTESTSFQLKSNTHGRRSIQQQQLPGPSIHTSA